MLTPKEENNPKAPTLRASAREKELYRRWHLTVDKRIPEGYLDTVKESDLTLRIARITNVRTGRTFDLTLLTTIVRVTMPNEPIPADVHDFLASKTLASK